MAARTSAKAGGGAEGGVRRAKERGGRPPWRLQYRSGRCAAVPVPHSGERTAARGEGHADEEPRGGAGVRHGRVG